MEKRNYERKGGKKDGYWNCSGVYTSTRIHCTDESGPVNSLLWAGGLVGSLDYLQLG